jgi:hypothetical protein
MKSFLKNTMISLVALTLTIILIPSIIKMAIVNPEGLKKFNKTFS